MKRRDALLGSAFLAGLPVKSVLAATGDRIGDSIIPPAEEAGREKHVPIITIPGSVKAGEPFTVTVEVGKTISHPNTVEHHIKWIQLYALPEGSKYVVELGKFDFGPAYAQPKITVTVMLQKNSTIFALAHCNIHGLWDYSINIKV